MIITITQTAHTNKEEAFIKIEYNGRQQFIVVEDKVNWQNNTLSKNFNNCFMIRQMLEKVIIAAQKNEPIEFRTNIIE